MKVVEGLPPRMTYAPIAIDLELFRMNPLQLHRPSGQLACLTLSDGETVWLIEKEAQVEKALRRVERCRWIFHNASFDIRHLRRWADVPDRPVDRFWDTFLVERLLYGGWYDYFGLRDLTRRYCNVWLDKEVRELFSHSQELTPQMRAYAVKDPYYTWHIYQKQAKLLDADEGSLRCWQHIDAPFFWTTLRFKGIYINTRKWKLLADKWQTIADEISNSLKFNPASVPQVKAALEKAGLRNLPNTREGTLEKFRGNKLVDKILAYREASKRVSTYGYNIFDYVEADGRIYGECIPIGTETGRTAFRDINLQNQPNEPEYRDCFQAEPGNRFLAADYDGQEPNITAQLSQDPELLRMLREGEKTHLAVARLVFDDPTIKEYDQYGHKTHEYKMGKALNLGLTYGMEAAGLSSRTGLSVLECELLIQNYFRRLSGIKAYIDRSRQLGREDGYVRSPGGRRIWLNWYSYQAKNNACNAAIQAGGADMIKLATNNLYYSREGWAKDFPIIGPVHDELIAEIEMKRKARFVKALKAAMLSAYQEICPDVKAKYVVEIAVGKSWAAKA